MAASRHWKCDSARRYFKRHSVDSPFYARYIDSVEVASLYHCVEMHSEWEGEMDPEHHFMKHFIAIPGYSSKHDVRADSVALASKKLFDVGCFVHIRPDDFCNMVKSSLSPATVFVNDREPGTYYLHCPSSIVALYRDIHGVISSSIVRLKLNELSFSQRLRPQRSQCTDAACLFAGLRMDACASAPFYTPGVPAIEVVGCSLRLTKRGDQSTLHTAVSPQATPRFVNYDPKPAPNMLRELWNVYVVFEQEWRARGIIPPLFTRILRETLGETRYSRLRSSSSPSEALVHWKSRAR